MISEAILPKRTEIEISLFGSGFGESIVVHIGDSKWIVVDSCIDRSSKIPIPLSYLESLNIDVSKNVIAIIATHWHDDHIRGISKLVDRCKKAKFICSDALHFDEYLELIRMYSNRAMVQNPGLKEWSEILDLMISKKRSGVDNVTPVFASQNQLLLNVSLSNSNIYAKLWSLSPSDASKIESFLELKPFLIKEKQSRKALPIPKRNPSSIALLLSISGTHIIMGSDLEENGKNNVGWSAVINSDVRTKEKASIFKVPHHGSSTADHPKIWSELLVDNPYSLLTPFLLGKTKLPTNEDILRFKSRTSRLYATGLPKEKRSIRRSGAVEKQINEVTKSFRQVPGSSGHIRIRGQIDCNINDWQVELFDGALKL